jgi:hypothetical protein
MLAAKPKTGLLLTDMSPNRPLSVCHASAEATREPQLGAFPHRMPPSRPSPASGGRRRTVASMAMERSGRCRGMPWRFVGLPPQVRGGKTTRAARGGPCCRNESHDAVVTSPTASRSPRRDHPASARW